MWLEQPEGVSEESTAQVAHTHVSYETTSRIRQGIENQTAWWFNCPYTCNRVTRNKTPQLTTINVLHWLRAGECDHRQQYDARRPEIHRSDEVSETNKYIKKNTLKSTIKSYQGRNKRLSVDTGRHHDVRQTYLTFISRLINKLQMCTKV